MKVRKGVVARIFAYATAVALLLQLLLFMVSWLIEAAMPENTVHSLLGSEGIRWFAGSFSNNVASPVLAWILVLAIAWGAMAKSEILKAVRSIGKPLAYRQRFAMRVVLVELVVMAFAFVMLAVVPNAPLRSVTGQLFPSSFSRSIIPMLALAATVSSATFGLLSGAMRNVGDVFASLSHGVKRASSLLVFYVVASQLIQSIIYVFQLN